MWVMIIMVFTFTGGATMDSIDFSSQEKCEKAKQEIQAAEPSFKRYIWCVPQ